MSTNGEGIPCNQRYIFSGLETQGCQSQFPFNNLFDRDMHTWTHHSRGHNHHHPPSDKGTSSTMSQDHQAPSLPPLPPPPPQQEKDKNIVMEEPKVEKKWPEWLQPFLQTNFFVFCAHHSFDSHKMECNMYCLDCNNSNALCALCLVDHSTHHILQIRRSSYHDVIRVSEIQKYLDVSGVQTYIINSARVVFLNERPQIRASRHISITCLVCDRSLLDNSLYCSIACKFKAESKQRMKKVGNSNVAVAPRSPSIRRPSDSNNPQEKEKRSVKSNAAEAGQSSARPPSRRRKGIPHRAPFGDLAV